MLSIALRFDRRTAPILVIAAALLALITFIGPAHAQEAGARAQDAAGDEDASNVTLETRIVSATIYGHQAQIVRSGRVRLAPGEQRVVCDDLPEGFVESSLIVEGAGTADAQIVGIDFARQGREYRGTPRYQELEAEYDRLERERDELGVRVDAIERRNRLTKSLGDLSSASGKDDVVEGTFDTATWRELMEFIEKESLTGELRVRDIRDEIRELGEQMREVQTEMDRIGVSAMRGKDLLIDCDVTSGGSLTFEVTYIVAGASWVPEYMVRYLEADDEVEVTYAARVFQQTGEDWEGVDVLLSTASPHVGASPPKLFPHMLGAVAGELSGRVTDATTGSPLAFANVSLVGTPYGGMTNRDGFYEVKGIKSGTYTVRVSFMGYESGTRMDVRILAGTGKRLDFSLRPVTIRGSEVVVEAERPLSADVRALATQPGVVTRDGEIHVRGGRSSEVKHYVEDDRAEYAEMAVAGSEFAANLVIAKPVDLESGAEPRRVLVAQRRIPGEFVREATPRLSDHVFVSGTLENPLDVPILKGNAEVYVVSRPAGGGPTVTNFVGKDFLEDVAPGEEFTMHLGADQSLTVEQEVTRDVLSRSGDRKTKIRYTVTIAAESHRSEPVTLRVLDRVPVSMMKDVEVDDVEIEPEPGEWTDEGLLTWDLELGPGGSREIRIDYVVEFPSEFSAEAINLE